jgi:hypothetical protein
LRNLLGYLFFIIIMNNLVQYINLDKFSLTKCLLIICVNMLCILMIYFPRIHQ